MRRRETARRNTQGPPGKPGTQFEARRACLIFVLVVYKSFLFIAVFDRVHGVVGQAEMMADLVNENVADNRAKCFIMFRPVIKNRPPKQENHRRLRTAAIRLACGKIRSVKQAEQLELALESKIPHCLFVRKVLHHECESVHQRAELRRQRGESGTGQFFEIVE